MSKTENDLKAVKTAFVKRYGYEGSKIDKDLSALEKVFYTHCYGQFSRVIKGIELPPEQKNELLTALSKL